MQHLLSSALLALPLLLQPSMATTTAPNTLTAEEKAAGWQLLFDGRSLDGWRGYRDGWLQRYGIDASVHDYFVRVKP